ncbi:MAG: formylglycine-generating enzyme family protein [Gallionellaceae bacterium]
MNGFVIFVAFLAFISLQAHADEYSTELGNAANDAVYLAPELVALSTYVGPEMVAIPGQSYELGRYEVTQAEWLAVMEKNPSHFNHCGNLCPVEQVSWDDAIAFIHKLNMLTGRQYRLPTEAEWQYACFAGVQSEYCGGNDLDALGWYGNNGEAGGNSGQTTHQTGQKQSNGFGLYDMSGNVWEWVANGNESEQDWRALRGGSWSLSPEKMNAILQLKIAPTSRHFSGGGIRLARTLP